MNRGWVNSRIHSNTSSDLWNKRKRIDVLWNTSARMKKQNTSNSLSSTSNRLPLAHLCLHTTLNMCYLIIHIASPKAHKHTRTFTNQTNSNKMFKLFTVNLRWKSFAFHCRCRCRRQWQATTNKQRQWRQPRGRSHARARTHTRRYFHGENGQRVSAHLFRSAIFISELTWIYPQSIWTLCRQ